MRPSEGQERAFEKGGKMRKKYEPKLKAKVVLEALRSDETTAQIASRYGVHGNMVAKWKQQALKGLPTLFEKGKTNGQGESEELVSELYRQIGQLTVELEWVKKRLSLVG